MAKRRPNWRLVKTHRTYTPEEAATALGKHVNTVRGWLKDGLRTIEIGGLFCFKVPISWNSFAANISNRLNVAPPTNSIACVAVYRRCRQAICPTTSR